MIIDLKIFYLIHEDGRGWFRLFGRGLKWKDVTRHMLLFGERYGHAKYIKIGKWIIGYLPKSSL